MGGIMLDFGDLARNHWEEKSNAVSIGEEIFLKSLVSAAVTFILHVLWVVFDERTSLHWSWFFIFWGGWLLVFTFVEAVTRRSEKKLLDRSD